MSFRDIQTASVIDYPYLWVREADGGLTEGRKERPTAVGVRIEKPDGDILILFPVTTQNPGSDRIAREVPDTEKARAGLDQDKRQWIILDEYNLDIIGQSFYLRPNSAKGRFSRAFFAPLVREALREVRRVKRVDRR